jgi:hypothetical protein
VVAVRDCWSRWRRSSCMPGPGAQSWRGLQHSDAAPGPGGGSSPGTSLRKSQPKRGWADPCRMFAAGSWQVPSESVA